MESVCLQPLLKMLTMEKRGLMACGMSKDIQGSAGVNGHKGVFAGGGGVCV